MLQGVMILYRGVDFVISILIVDDEKNIRDSLKDLIPWHEIGVSNVITSKNGIEGLKCFIKNKPDIVITDIRMPKMDGIQFTYELRKLDSNLPIIFLSAFDEKEYLKSAIHFKVIDYVEKPIDPVNIIKVVKNAISRFEQENKQKEIIRIKEYIEKQDLTLKLIRGELDYTYKTGGYFTVGCAKINHSRGMPDMRNDILKSINLSMPSVLTGFLNEKNLAIILEGKIDLSTSQQNNLFVKLLDTLKELYPEGTSISIGISEPTKDLCQLPFAFNNAKNIVSTSQFYNGVNKLYFKHYTSGTNLGLKNENFVLFKTILEIEGFSSAIRYIQGLTSRLHVQQYADIQHIKDIYFNLIQVLEEFIFKRNLKVIGEKKEDEYLWQSMDDFITLRDISNFIINQLTFYKEQIQKLEGISKKIYEINRFINNNYSDKKFSIQVLASHMFLSTSYLCFLYKKETGKTINEYLTELRVEKACELLKGLRLKLYEIADSVGYSDSNYFSIIFKKHTGFTPSEFRERAT
jgi:two-component system response regulator YesN